MIRLCALVGLCVLLAACTRPAPVDPTLKPIPRDPAPQTGVTFSGDARFGVSKGL
ncbi:hypothetical protein [uncultured Roseobacter sp.]|uniref:hypothetical protein n=1 Tax=uncultured Roseobacter sp. TaxID=114847 RepID=UPI002609523A|nr:hypothetical protein [uncultured Roseobacter sp.]